MTQMVQYQYGLLWKEFNVNLDKVRLAMVALSIPGFCGLSADDNLRVLFTEVPSDEHKTAIDSYWGDVASDSDEATSYYSGDQLKFALAAARADAATKDWGDLSVQQKKLISNAALSEADNTALIAAFHE